VIEAYEQELVRSKEPGYLCTYDDYGEEHYATLREPFEEEYSPPRIVRTDESSHRIEPAAADSVPQHHNAPANPRYNTVAHQGAHHGARQTARADQDDSFGAGIE
jgi:stage V sporulation protein G